MLSLQEVQSPSLTARAGGFFKKLGFACLGAVGLRVGVPFLLWLLAIIGVTVHTTLHTYGLLHVTTAPDKTATLENALEGFVSIASLFLGFFALRLTLNVLAGLGQMLVGALFACWKLLKLLSGQNPRTR